jgi:hypothetical protein
MSDVWINDTAYDSSCVTATIAGFAVPGFYGSELGKGLTKGKAVPLMGNIGPSKRTRGRWSPDGFSLKVLFDQLGSFSNIIASLSSGGSVSSLGPEQLGGVTFNLVVAYEAAPGTGTITVTLWACRAYGPDIQGAGEPDSDDPAHGVYDLQPMNRSIKFQDGTELFDWIPNDKTNSAS